jgi:hypothetical protein
MEGEVGDIPGSIKDSMKDFGLEGLAEHHSSMPYVQAGFQSSMRVPGQPFVKVEPKVADLVFFPN